MNKSLRIQAKGCHIAPELPVSTWIFLRNPTWNKESKLQKAMRALTQFIQLKNMQTNTVQLIIYSTFYDMYTQFRNGFLSEIGEA
jgi:hypothetical protein